MKDVNFNALLVASRPKKYSTNKVFTDRVMNAIQTSEILSSSMRKMEVNKKETFIMKFRHLPKFAIIAIAIGTLLIVSTGAYAAYQLLWQKPEVHVSAPQKSANGRDQVAISLKQCGDSTLASRYELKKNASITADQVAGVVQARCELDAIGTWAMDTFPHDGRSAPLNRKEHDSTTLDTSMATHIKSIDSDTITFTGLTKYNQTDTTFPRTENIRYIADGHDVKANQITANDPVVYITTETRRIGDSSNCDQGCSIPTQHLSTTLRAVVKLSMPFENYDQFAWQSLTERISCAGNSTDTCLTGFIGGIDLYDGSAVLGKSEMKEIQGTITQLNGKSIVIKSSSGSLFTIVTPNDIVSNFNTTRASSYANQLVKVGGTLRVSYVESSDKHTKTLSSEMLISVDLQTEAVGKSDLQAVY